MTFQQMSCIPIQLETHEPSRMDTSALPVVLYYIIYCMNMLYQVYVSILEHNSLYKIVNIVVTLCMSPDPWHHETDVATEATGGSVITLLSARELQCYEHMAIAGLNVGVLSLCIILIS